MKCAVYAGSFDPTTLGHMYVIGEAAKLFDELIVAIGDNSEKKYAFSERSRIDMLKDCVRLLNLPTENVRVDYFCNRFLIDYANEQGASYIIRGIRNSQDFEFEKAMRHLNADLAAGITTLSRQASWSCGTRKPQGLPCGKSPINHRPSRSVS